MSRILKFPFICDNCGNDMFITLKNYINESRIYCKKCNQESIIIPIWKYNGFIKKEENEKQTDITAIIKQARSEVDKEIEYWEEPYHRDMIAEYMDKLQRSIISILENKKKENENAIH